MSLLSISKISETIGNEEYFQYMCMNLGLSKGITLFDEVSKIFILVNDTGLSHWYLIVIDVDKISVDYYDLVALILCKHQVIFYNSFCYYFFKIYIKIKVEYKKKI